MAMENNYILPFLWLKGETKEIIREEIEKIEACGIKAICLESRPHPDFMGEQWWSDIAFIIEEAKKRDMKIWILDDAHFPTGYANGLIKSKYPERKKSYLRYNVVNVWGKQGAVSVNIRQMTKPLVSFLELDKPMDFEERAKNRLVSVSAYPLREDHKLDESGAIDLTEEVKDGYLNYHFPKDNYRIFVVYETRTDGGNADYINMMDKTSVSTLIEAVYQPHFDHFSGEFGKTIAGFFSDEPEIGNVGGFLSDMQIGNSSMPLPYSPALREKLKAAYGGNWKVKLPYLWVDTWQMKECPQIRHGFMDAVTTLYQENFSNQLGGWCEAHGVSYIGHVVEDDNLHQRLGNGTGHFFRAMAGQHMAGIDVIADQVVPGDRGYTKSGIFKRSGAFFHYALAKMGASAAHLDPKKKGRTMCELFGASGWHTGVRDMKYILDHLLVRGVNYLVPHAFSMAEYPDGDCPPHFYARGNNPQFPYFANLMKYANRMCSILNDGTHMASVAVLYPAEAEWSGRAMLLQEPARELQEHQIEFDFISADMLADLETYNGSVREGILTINRQEFEYLVIPYGTYITEKAYRFLKGNPGIKSIFIDGLPSAAVGTMADEKEFDETMEKCLVVPLGELGSFLQKHLKEEARLELEFRELVYYHYKKGQDIHVFHNESVFDTFQGYIRIPLQKGAVYYAGMEDKFYRLPIEEKDGKKRVKIEIRPYGLGIVFDMDPSAYPVYQPLSRKLEECTHRKKLVGAWEYSTAVHKEYPVFSEKRSMKHLKPVSDLMPEFSGHICYEKEFEVSEVTGTAYLEFTEAYEVVALWLNGEFVAEIQYPPYIFDVGSQIRKGKNKIKAIVTTTLDREQRNCPEPFIILDYTVSEPTGLCGDVEIYYS